MKIESYWTASAPAFVPRGRAAGAVRRASVGGGFTGLSAALALARRGASVVVLEAAGVSPPRLPAATAGT